MPSNVNPNLPVVNKCKKDITDRVPPRKSSALLVKLEVVATQPVKVVQLDCTKTHQAIRHALRVHLVLPTKVKVLLDAMPYLPVPTAGMATFKNVHRVTTARVKQKTKQLVSQACMQQWKDPLHASTVLPVSTQHSMLL